MVYAQFDLYTDPDCFKNPGQFWNSQRCLECKNENCYCSIEKDCSSCKQNYYYDWENKDCVKCPQGCKHCCMRQELSNITCTSCFEGYFKIAGTCIKVDNCIDSELGKCIKCEQGYYLNSEQKCTSCDYQAGNVISKCSQCYNNTYCITCSQGYYKENIFDADGHILCKKCQVQNCKTCDSSTCYEQNTECFVEICIEGYLLQPATNTCKKCDLDKCKKCVIDQNNEVCSLCQTIIDINNNQTIEYFILAENSEVKCITCSELFPNCFQCIDPQLSETYCQLCQQGFYKAPNCTDRTKCCFPCPPNVKRCYNYSSIQQCIDGYVLVNDEIDGLLCVENVNNCALVKTTKEKFYISQECELCKIGDQMTSDFKCLSCAVPNCQKCQDNQTNVCKLCNELYFVNNSGQCEKCSDQNCSTCSENQNTCAQCKPGYRLNSIKSCEKCQDSMCSTCNNDKNICDTCVLGYGIQKDISTTQCKKCLPGCKVCEEQKTCIECEEKYWLDKRHLICHKFLDNCLAMVPRHQFLVMIAPTDKERQNAQKYIDSLSEEFLKDESMYCQVCEVDIINNIHYLSRGHVCTQCNNVESGQFDCPNTCLLDPVFPKLNSGCLVFKLFQFIWLLSFYLVFNIGGFQQQI